MAKEIDEQPAVFFEKIIQAYPKMDFRSVSIG